MKYKRFLALLLAVVMVLSCVPAAFAAESGFATTDTAVPETTVAPVGLTQAGGEEVAQSSFAEEAILSDLETKLVESAVERFSETDAAQTYEADDVVTFVVVLEKKPLLAAGFTTSQIAAQTASVRAYENAQVLAIDRVKTSLTETFGTSEDFRLGYTFTVATTGLSVTTKYGNMEAIEAMAGVDHVYVAPTFQLPEDFTLDTGNVAQPMTDNATTMVGADTLNTNGYTGKGMKIAILDTGIALDHPSFQALPEDKLTEDSLTKEYVESVWNELNASQTSQLNRSYYNSKLPFVFNYNSLDFNVDNTYAGSDHGTHVAGIAAANKLETTSVVGVAPDAQIVVMQVFQPDGGAAWPTIMAALEDCVRLNVDAANLSLGAAAGFSSAKDDFCEVIELFTQSDIELVIAAGNETNSAYQNLTGTNMSLAGNPDTGIVGTPSTYPAALSVASVDNDGMDMLYFTVNGRQIGYSDTATSSATQFLANFAGQTLEFVAVPGLGEDADYEGLDVTGKVALVSRGSISFMEKQATAQSHGAVACVVYNNVPGALNMQISSGGNNIPCVSITKADGDYLKSLSTGSLTVCQGDLVHVNLGQVLSDFSSWGVSPDLQLKPEIAGVGGSIYSCTNPAISGSYYGYMSGTSMACPQVTGAITLMLQYLRENTDLEGGELRRVAADLLMSTASPVLYDGTLEYSPRGQGAGLIDLEKATTTEAYLTSRDAYESRPKGEFGDDPEKTGVYEFGFEIHNMSADQDLSYTFDASILTETLVADTFIGGAPYALDGTLTVYEGTYALRYDFNDDGAITTADARVLLRHINGAEAIEETNWRYAYIDVNGDGTADKQDVDVITAFCAELETDVDVLATELILGTEGVTSVTVPAGETAVLTAKLTLTDADKEYMDSFPNGIYVEGFLYVNAAEDTGVSLSMPFVGFYGDWSDAPVFDSENEDEASMYPRYVFTNYSRVGTNPYIRTGASGDEYNAFSYSNPLAEIDVGLLRNAKKLRFSVTDTITGEIYFDISGEEITKSYYYPSYGAIIPFYVLADEGEVWDGTDADGNKLPDGTKVTYKAEAWVDDGDDLVDDSFQFDITLDDKAPVIVNANTLQEDLKFENGRVILPLTLKDNQHIAAVIFLDAEGIIMGKFAASNVPGEEYEADYDITGFGTEFTIVVADYACNETEIDVSLDLGEYSDVIPTVQPLDKDRLYGCETFDMAYVEPGWFSANKADLSDAKNETYDSSSRYYAAEYVNGYLIAQSAITGDLVLVTPSGTYWSQQTLVSQSGSVGDYGVWVLYDMALDYSGVGGAIYDDYDGAYDDDTLYAVGWMYGGDEDGDGKDNGYNALFTINFYSWGNVMVDAVARIAGTDDGAEILTLGCTTEGQLYGIDTNGKLYSIDPNYYWDENVGDWGDNVVNCTYIGTTDFVNELNYSGVNVIQSMGYDHNTDTMYWYAHSQTPAGYYYINVCETYTVDLETAKCTEVGTYGPSGQTCLFVPTDLESDLFTMGVNPERFQLDPYSTLMVEGQTKRLSIDWSPWNAAPTEVTWTSSDENLATVDQHGLVTAIAEGEVTITATAQIWNEWAYDPETYTYSGAWQEYTGYCTIRIVPSEEAIYGYIVSDFKNADNDFSWVTYSDQTPTAVTQISKPVTTPELGETGSALWQGGAYSNGYVYTTQVELVQGSDMTLKATVLYKSKVTKGETPDQTTIGAPERVGYTAGIEIGNMGFDYNTGRMYGVDLTNGGLAIIDLDTGAVDSLGAFSGDIGGAAIATAMCVTADGTIVIANMFGTLYSVDPDTLYTTRLGSIDSDTWYYAGMTYDYNTGNIYWNPCMSANASPLYLVLLEQDEWDPERTVATIMKMGNVSTKAGVEQTAMFTIPDNEPETKQIPVESIEITNGETISGLVGGSAQLNTVTTPARPTVSARTWTTSDPDVVTVDRFGVLSYNGVGTATVTVSITNKDEATYGGPFTDSIEVTVYGAAGEMQAFLTSDYGGSSYYDFWLTVNDYDVRNSPVGDTSINIYSLRVGAYYDGYIYGYNENSQFMRIKANQHSSYTYLGTANLNLETQQVTGMALDYNTGTMYALTRDAYGVKGALWTVNLDNGSLTKVADLSEFVFALAAGVDGTLYAAGAPGAYSDGALYTVDKATGECTKVLDLPGSRIWTGEVYYGTQQYNPAMTYDFGTNRLYLNATSDPMYGDPTNTGVYMVLLDNLTAVNLGKLCVQTRAGSAVKEGNATLGLLISIPEADEVPVSTVNGIILNKTSGRVAVNDTAQLTAEVRPSNAANPAVTWSSSDETVATVADGVVTGLSAGTAIITVTSVENPSVTATCSITVVELTGEQSVAYTASALTDSLYTFNPALPAKTAEAIGPFSGGSNIKGMAAGDNCLYYVIDDNFTFYLYRYDLASKQTTSLGILEAWTGIQDIAYDPVNDLLYGVGGFYVYQYKNVSQMSGGYNSMSGYLYTMITLSGVACDDEGNVYYVGNDWGPVVLCKTDKLFYGYETLARDIDLSVVPGQTEMAYDSSVGLFYITDASSNIYTLDLSGNVTLVDILGDGIDMNGLAIVPAKSEEP